MGEFTDPRLGASPFERLFNPDSPDNSPVSNFMGMIGSAAGVPGQRERNIQYQNKVGDIQSEAMSELSRIISTGVAPEQALTKLLQTDVGKNWFARSDPAAITKLATDYAASTRPPTDNTVVGGSLVQTNKNQPGQATVLHSEPKMGNVGSTMINERTGQPVYTEAPQAVREFKYFTNFLQDNPERIKQLAEMQATPSAVLQTGQEERAVKELVRLGLMTPEIAGKITAKVIELKPIKGGPDDKDIGYMVFDKSQAGDPNYKPTFVPVPNMGFQPGAGTGVPTIPGTPGAQSGRPSASMFMGAGLAAGTQRNVASGLGNVSGAAGEAATGDSNVVVNQTRMDALAAGVSGLATTLPGDRQLTSQAKALTKLLPENGMLTEPPKVALEKAMLLRSNIEEMIQHYTQVYSNPGASHANRVDADKAVTALQNVERLLPTMADMQKQHALVKKNGGGILDTGLLPTMFGAGNKAVSAISDAMFPGTTKEQPQQQAQQPAQTQPIRPAINEGAVLRQIPNMQEPQLQEMRASGQAMTPAVRAAVTSRIKALIAIREKGK